MNPTLDLCDLLSRVPVIPVLTIDDAGQAVPLARALVAGGLSVLEVTLRTDAAVESIAAIAEQVPEAVVGSGTVLEGADLERSRGAGARFAVSPGLTPGLADAASRIGLPLLPGVATASEAMTAREQGFRVLKLFPASVVGGTSFLKAVAGPLPDLAFCPTGGIGPTTFHDYLSLPNVLCVGGSWVAPRDVVAAGDWTRITELSREATT